MRTSYIPLTNRLIGLRDRNIYVRKFGPIYNPFSLMFLKQKTSFKVGGFKFERDRFCTCK